MYIYYYIYTLLNIYIYIYMLTFITTRRFSLLVHVVVKQDDLALGPHLGFERVSGKVES